MLTKFNTFTNIFEISLENLRINIESREIDKNWEDFNLIFFGSLIFLKLEITFKFLDTFIFLNKVLFYRFIYLQFPTVIHIMFF